MIKSLAGRLGVPDECVTISAARMSVRGQRPNGETRQAGIETDHEPPAGSLLLDFVIQLPSDWTSGAARSVVVTLRGLRKEARKGHLSIGEMLVFEMTEPVPPGAPAEGGS